MIIKLEKSWHATRRIGNRKNQEPLFGISSCVSVQKLSHTNEWSNERTWGCGATFFPQQNVPLFLKNLKSNGTQVQFTMRIIGEKYFNEYESIWMGSNNVNLVSKECSNLVHSKSGNMSYLPILWLDMSNNESLWRAPLEFQEFTCNIILVSWWI